jgi:hypothetical protein
VTRASSRLALVGVAIVLCTLVALPAGTAGASGVGATAASSTPRLGVWPTFHPGLHADIASSRVQLLYRGGPVVSDLHSIDVSYGAGSFISPGHPGASAVGDFTGQFLSSGVEDWLGEYDTPVSGGTGQTIGRGTFGGTVTIAPSAPDDGSTISDAQIQAELGAQITSGVLPAPDADTSYALFFPLGKTICDGGSCSLVAGGFCAYHGTFLRSGVPVTYQVLPDLTGTNGCGTSTDLGNTTSVLSHELSETITDPDVGIATVIGPPLGWYDAANGEVADICNAQQATFVGTDTVTYVVQKVWSNVHKICFVGAVPGPPLAIATTSVVPGSHGVPYAQTLVATGGNAPYTWKLVKGAGTLPRGVKLDKLTGTLSGTPKLAGTYPFTVEVLDTKTATRPRTRNTTTQAYTLLVS